MVSMIYHPNCKSESYQFKDRDKLRMDVHGQFQVLIIDHDWVMVVNEKQQDIHEGFNFAATIIAKNCIPIGSYITGNAVILRKKVLDKG